jgi:hypothetical protein
MNNRPCERCTGDEWCSPENRLTIEGCPFKEAPDKDLLTQWGDELEAWINDRDWHKAGGLAGNVVLVIEAKAKAIEAVLKMRKASEGKK